MPRQSEWAIFILFKPVLPTITCRVLTPEFHKVLTHVYWPRYITTGSHIHWLMHARVPAASSLWARVASLRGQPHGAACNPRSEELLPVMLLTFPTHYTCPEYSTSINTENRTLNILIPRLPPCLCPWLHVSRSIQCRATVVFAKFRVWNSVRWPGTLTKVSLFFSRSFQILWKKLKIDHDLFLLHPFQLVTQP